MDQCSRARPTTLCRDSMMRRLLGTKVALLMAATSGSGPPYWRPTTLSRICRSLSAAPGDTLACGSAAAGPLTYLLGSSGVLPSLLAPPTGMVLPDDRVLSLDTLRPFWRGHVWDSSSFSTCRKAVGGVRSPSRCGADGVRGVAGGRGGIGRPLISEMTWISAWICWRWPEFRRRASRLWC